MFFVRNISAKGVTHSLRFISTPVLKFLLVSDIISISRNIMYLPIHTSYANKTKYLTPGMSGRRRCDLFVSDGPVKSPIHNRRIFFCKPIHYQRGIEKRLDVLYPLTENNKTTPENYLYLVYLIEFHSDRCY